MTESLAAATFYVGLALFVFGAIRAVRASVEQARRDSVGIAALVAGALAFSVAIAVFVQSAKGVLPFYARGLALALDFNASEASINHILCIAIYLDRIAT